MVGLRDWTRKTEPEGEPPAKFANFAKIPAPEGQNSTNSNLSTGWVYRNGEDYFNIRVREAISDLNRRGVSIMDYPPATRHRALELEESMTRAANAGNRKIFLENLKQWRECFH